MPHSFVQIYYELDSGSSLEIEDAVVRYVYARRFSEEYTSEGHSGGVVMLDLAQIKRLELCSPGNRYAVMTYTPLLSLECGILEVVTHFQKQVILRTVTTQEGKITVTYLLQGR